MPTFLSFEHSSALCVNAIEFTILGWHQIKRVAVFVCMLHAVSRDKVSETTVNLAAVSTTTPNNCKCPLLLSSTCFNGLG